MIHKVLVVEDSPDLGELYQQVFSHEEDYEIILAENGKEALDLLNNNKDFKPEAILLDLYMPVMGGAEFIVEQRKNPSLAEIPVLVCSASRDGIPTGVSYLQKPIDIDDLFGILEKMRHDHRKMQ